MSTHTFFVELDRVLTSALFMGGLETIFFGFDYHDQADPDDRRFMFPALRDSNLLRGTLSIHYAAPLLFSAKYFGDSVQSGPTVPL